MRREWKGRLFELVPTSDGLHECNECFFLQFIERDHDNGPCADMGVECCYDENVGKVWKEVVKNSEVVTEHGTEKSNNLEVKCPKCGHEFNVCCEW